MIETITFKNDDEMIAFLDKLDQLYPYPETKWTPHRIRKYLDDNPNVIIPALDDMVPHVNDRTK